jgi:hypothetical protein
MTVGMGVPMVMSVAVVMFVAVGMGMSHSGMLYYNITGVYRLGRNCRRRNTTSHPAIR